ncbi:MAG: DUF3244 domain-containing protein [Paludibacter sp.]|nr:DUF3244 domain-containing protein [Paludibacter sp.]
MKKINFKLLGFFIVSLSLFTNQVVYADILIRKDDPAPGGGSNIATQSYSLSTTTSTKTYSSSTKFVIPVTADVVGSELFVDFTISVGTAYVSVVDANGSVVYQTAVDTYSTPEVVIPVDGLSSGKYSLKISYGSTSLTGNFQL